MKHAACFRCLMMGGAIPLFANDDEFVLNFKGLFPRMVTYMMSPTLLRGRRAALVLSLTMVSCWSFCLHGAAAAAAKKGEKKSASSPNLGMVGQGTVMDLPDPKFPGKGVPLLHVRAATVTGQSAETGLLGSMTQVSALLYQQGKQAATLTAPLARGDSLRGSVVVTATGGVFIRSLLHPGTTLRADRLVWTPSARTNQIVATGHVVWTDGKTHGTIKGSRATADTAVKTVAMGAGDVSALL